MKFELDRLVSLEKEMLISIIEEFCVYLFILMVIWFFTLVIVHNKRVFSFRIYLKSFYKGLSKIGNKEFFNEYVKSHFNRIKSRKGSSFVDIFSRQLVIFQNYQKNKNRPQYLVELSQLHSCARDTFAHNNSQILSIQLTSAFFIFITYLFRVIFSPWSLSLLPLFIVGLFILFSIWLYVRREKQGDRAVGEIDKLESIYLKYLAV